MNKIGKHLFYWLVGSAIVFCIFLTSVYITDIHELDGTTLQRKAAGLNLFLGLPGHLLYAIMPNAPGPAYLTVIVTAWGLLLGEIALCIRWIIRK